MKAISELKQDVINGVFDESFAKLYGTEGIMHARNRYSHLCDEGKARFGDKEAVFFSAPGRTEVGGNHTDHQLGRVLAASLNLDIAAVVVPSHDNVVTYTADEFKAKPVDISDLAIHPEEKNTTESLIRGIAAAFVNHGHKVSGFGCYAESDVLPGSGMSSSAAFEVLIGTIFSDLFNDGSIGSTDVAKYGQYAENTYFMKASGLMDQMACATGGFVAIDFYDRENPVIEHLDLDLDAMGYDLVITDCKASHADLSDEYSLIPAEMKEAAAVMGQEVLSRVSMADLLSHAVEIREKCGDRAFLRAYHFLNETARAKEEKEALQAKDVQRFLDLVNESGRSSFMYLQNVKVNGDAKHQALAVGLALSEEVLGKEGAFRVHGGGFAGTIQAFVPKHLTGKYLETLDGVFGKGSAHVLRIRSIGGCQIG